MLVLAGENWERYPYERGCPNATHGAQTLVVFALRPARGAIAPRLLDTSGAGAGGELAWYKWLNVCPIQGIPWGWGLSQPRDGDVLSTAELSLNFRIDPPYKMSWRIDADGDRIPESLVYPTYRMARELNRDLPPIEAFQLQDTPPGQISESGQ